MLTAKNVKILSKRVKWQLLHSDKYPQIGQSVTVPFDYRGRGFEEIAEDGSSQMLNETLKYPPSS